MSLFKNRAVATLITAVCIAGSVLISTNRFLGTECQAITDSFYSGVIYDGYLHPSINDQLRQRANAANGLVSVAANYPELEAKADAVRNSRLALLEVEDIKSKYKANEGLDDAVSELIKAMSAVSLSEDDAASADSYLSTFNSAQGVIDKSGYNEAVRDFARTTLNVLPANILSELAGVDEPVLFQ